MTTIEDILMLVDTLAPNNCTKQQKLYWFNQCESIIFEKAVHRYKYVETKVSAGIVELPEGYNSSDIEAVYIDGKFVGRINVSIGFGNIVSPQSKVIGVVLKEHYKEVKYAAYEGSIGFNGSTLTMQGHPFVSGDSIDIDCTGFKGRVKVLGTSGSSIYTDNNFVSNTVTGKAEKALDGEVSLKMPYDRLYIDYITAQIDYYNKDFEGYNNNMYIFDKMLDELTRTNKSRSFGTGLKRLVHIW